MRVQWTGRPAWTTGRPVCAVTG